MSVRIMKLISRGRALACKTKSRTEAGHIKSLSDEIEKAFIKRASFENKEKYLTRKYDKKIKYASAMHYKDRLQLAAALRLLPKEEKKRIVMIKIDESDYRRDPMGIDFSS